MFVTGDDYSNDASTYPLYPQSSAKHKTLLQLDAAKILGICQETKANTCRLLSSSYMQCIKEIRDVCFECMLKYFIRSVFFQELLKTIKRRKNVGIIIKQHPYI